MSSFRVKLAGIPLEVSPLFEDTVKFCAEFLTEETPLFSVAVTQEDIEAVRVAERRTAINEGRPVPEHTDRYLEKLALAGVVLEKLLDHGILLFHGSVMAVNGRAYMFTADSGTGKTTHCRLWLKNIPGCHILNGDKPLILFQEGRVYASGSPWKGKEQYGVNEMLPLEAICLLERGSTNRIEKITLGDGILALIRQCHIPHVKPGIAGALGLLKQLSAVRLYRLSCNMEDEAALLSFAELTRE